MGFLLPAHLFECTPVNQAVSNEYGPDNLDLIDEVRMSNDSSFQNQPQGSDPSRPDPEIDDPTLDPDDPKKYDPLSKPGMDRPEDWEDPDRVPPEADEQTPLSDDRR
ncbi:hypothetical protein VA602_03740 [Pseudomonas sp. MH2]|uniref:Uncharacterized protein n=1 Tax=Pseudomonas machongensis TaxID=3110229 RepID=A0ABU5VCD3_9PSED|nr:hypothetical protein [Pseudomonas sp. MH2]MEA5670448.1 hypothetical protein [Pseudomonas sp. MH2]